MTQDKAQKNAASRSRLQSAVDSLNEDTEEFGATLTFDDYYDGMHGWINTGKFKCRFAISENHGLLGLSVDCGTGDCFGAVAFPTNVKETFNLLCAFSSLKFGRLWVQPDKKNCCMEIVGVEIKVPFRSLDGVLLGEALRDIADGAQFIQELHDGEMEDAWNTWPGDDGDDPDDPREIPKTSLN